MKTLSLLAYAALAGAAWAQETPPEIAPVPQTLFPEGTPAAAPSRSPASAPRGRGRSRGQVRTQFATDAAIGAAAADPLEVRIAYRKAKTRALLDPALSDLLVQSERAPTDDEKRALLRTYYTRLYAAVRRIDPTPAMKAHIDSLAKASEQRYDPKRRSLSDENDLNGGNGGGRGGRGRR